MLGRGEAAPARAFAFFGFRPEQLLLESPALALQRQ